MALDDPIIEEVRNVREAYAKQFNYDLDAMYRDLKRKERKSKHTVEPAPERTTTTRSPMKSA